MSKEIYDKKDIYDELNKQVYFRDGGSVNLASLASSVEKVRSNSKSGGNNKSESGVIVLNPDWEHMPTTRTRMTEKVAWELLGCSEDDLYNILESRYSKLLVMFNNEEAAVFHPDTERFTIVSGEFVACNINGNTPVVNAKLYIELSKFSVQYVYTSATGELG